MRPLMMLINVSIDLIILSHPLSVPSKNTNISSKTSNYQLLDHVHLNLISDIYPLSVSTNNLPTTINQKRLIKLTERQNSSFVIVGYCCHTHSGIYDLCEPQKFVTDIAKGTFNKLNKEIIYQQCTKSGLAPKIFINPYSNISISNQQISSKQYLQSNNTNLYNKLLSQKSNNNELPIWYDHEPDILYAKDIFLMNQSLKIVMKIVNVLILILKKKLNYIII